MNLEFLDKKPRCFGEFKLVKPESSKAVSEFVKRYVVCKCNNEELNIYTSYGNGMYLAPILLECPKCGHREQIFNPEIHGWDGENGDNCSMVGTEEPKVLPGCPMKVMTEYSYQGAENYEDLSEDGVTNLEDYFDTFNLYGLDANGNILESIDYECA